MSKNVQLGAAQAVLSAPWGMFGVPGKLLRPPLATAELLGRVGVPAGVPAKGIQLSSMYYAGH